MPDARTKPKVEKNEAEWRAELTPMQYAVLREKATERPFSGEYEHEHRAAPISVPAAADAVRIRCQVRFRLRLAEFHAAGVGEHVDEERDISHGMIRTEVLCSKCNAISAMSSRTAPRPPDCATASIGGAETAAK